MTAALLTALEAAGIRLSLAGEDLHYQTRPGVRIAPYREQITTHKPVLMAELRLRERIVAAATADPTDFDRAAYDRLWAEWRTLQEETP